MRMCVWRLGWGEFVYHQGAVNLDMETTGDLRRRKRNEKNGKGGKRRGETVKKCSVAPKPSGSFLSWIADRSSLSFTWSKESPLSVGSWDWEREGGGWSRRVPNTKYSYRQECPTLVPDGTYILLPTLVWLQRAHVEKACIKVLENFCGFTQAACCKWICFLHPSKTTSQT